MELKLAKIPPSCGRLIPVPSELIPSGVTPGDVRFLKSGGERFWVYDKFIFNKTDLFPTALMYAATGQEIKPESIWNKFKRSEFFVLFVCKGIDQEEKPKEIKKEVQIEIPDL